MRPTTSVITRPRRVLGIAGTGAACILLAAGAGQAQGGGAPQAPAGPPSSQTTRDRIDDLVRQAVRRYTGEPAEPAREAADSQTPAAPPATPLTLDDTVALALEKNLDIAVERSNPPAYDLSLAGLRAVYRPTITSTLGNQRQVEPPVTELTGGERVSTDTAALNGGVSQNLPRGGGNVGLAWNNTRVASNSLFYNFNPSYNATLTAQYTQPLVRGFRTDAARQQITVTKLNREMSGLQLQSTIINTVSSVRKAYWDLAFAVQSVAVAKQSVDLAHALVTENQRRLAFGTMTRLDVVGARSEEATAEHALVQAEGTRRLAELALKRLIVASAQDPLWQATLVPADRPAIEPQPVDVAAAVRRALGARLDLEQARRQAAANQATLALLRDQTRPQADLAASYSLAGLGGTGLVRSGTIFDSQVTGTIPGGFDDALRTMVRHDYPSWSVSLNFSYPLGLSSAKAAVARAQIQMKQADTELRQMEVQVATEVTNAAIQVRNGADEMRTATAARQLAQDKLDAEQKKFQAGVSTNYFVVQAQRDLADAENQELQAQVAYRKALVDFERSQQTTLQAAGITIVSASGLAAPPVGSGRPPGQ